MLAPLRSVWQKAKLSGVPPIDVYVFDCSRGEFLDTDLYIKAATEAESEENDS